MNDVAGAVAAGLAAEAPELSAVTLEFTKRIARMQTLVEVATSPTLSKYSLSRGEYDVLSTLRSTGTPFRLKPTALTQRLLFTTGGMSNLLRSLAARGYVDKEPDPTDGRSYWVRLTEEGADVALAVVRDAVAAQTQLLFPANETTVKQIVDGLSEILMVAETSTTGSRR
jgi:DNA-binding MarR family transcriptional regulator